MGIKTFQIGIIIATSLKRTNLLFSRSLKSALDQTYSPDFIVIVDDNNNKNEFEKILKKVNKLNNQSIFCIRNFKTRHNSGTGAWNSGIEFLCNKFNNVDNSYIAILDDDDEWNNTYLEKCVSQIKLRGIENTRAVFAGLVRLHKNFKVKSDLNKENLTIDKFLYGNPGVQGSNMFFNLQSLLDIGGFDEHLKSCTDRDLLIRFLKQNSVDKIALVDETLVCHYAQGADSVTNNPSIKWAGLDSFYNKYLFLFTVETLDKSLNRAEKNFAYPNRAKILNLYNERKAIVLAMPLFNGAKTIRKAVLSAINQKNVKQKLILVIGNDNSTDEWKHEIDDLITDNIIIINIVKGGKSYKIRNAINDYILNNLKNVAYIGRLDADDELADDFVISELEKIIENQNPDVIIAGNYQQKESKIIGKNTADRNLLNFDYLLERLHKMSLDIPEAELPSCNTFVKPECIINYPEKESAEDHWFTVELLLRCDKLKVHIAEDLFYSIYSLSGNLTHTNRNKEMYIQSRKELYEYFRGRVNGQKE
jgi:glycosyltransferase involved in cell wall biosynthesis